METHRNTKFIEFVGTDGHFKNGESYTYEEYAEYVGLKRNTMVTRLSGRQVCTDEDLRPSGQLLRVKKAPTRTSIWDLLETRADILSQKWLRKKL